MTQRVVVVGSGIAGAATAFALARRGAAVSVVDDGAVGQATAASAGIIAPWVSASSGRFYEVYAAGAAFYPTLLEQLAELGVTHTDYRRTGSLVVHRDPLVLAEAEERVRARVAAAGPVAGEVDRLDADGGRRAFPPLAPGLHALFVSGGARVDGRTLREALLEGAVRAGAERIPGRARAVPDRPAVVVGHQVHEADAVVVAAGAWSAGLLAPGGFALPVAPQRGQIMHLRVPQDTARWPTVIPLSHHYIVSFDDGRIAVGATRETGSGFDPRVTAAGVHQVLTDALAIAPGLADATVLETRVGLRPLPEGLPVVGPLPAQPGWWVATGYGAAGLTMAPLLGDALARGILGQASLELDGLNPRV